jgi:hypothetical protein
MNSLQSQILKSSCQILHTLDVCIGDSPVMRTGSNIMIMMLVKVLACAQICDCLFTCRPACSPFSGALLGAAAGSPLDSDKPPDHVRGRAGTALLPHAAGKSCCATLHLFFNCHTSRFSILCSFGTTDQCVWQVRQAWLSTKDGDNQHTWTLHGWYNQMVQPERKTIATVAAAAAAAATFECKLLHLPMPCLAE